VSIDASPSIKNANFLVKYIDEVIKEVGEKNLVQTVMDNR